MGTRLGVGHGVRSRVSGPESRVSRPAIEAGARYDPLMSFVVFGVIILFAIYAMAHFLHEWHESRRPDRTEHDDS